MSTDPTLRFCGSRARGYRVYLKTRYGWNYIDVVWFQRGLPPIKPRGWVHFFSRYRKGRAFSTRRAAAINLLKAK